MEVTKREEVHYISKAWSYMTTIRTAASVRLYQSQFSLDPVSSSSTGS